MTKLERFGKLLLLWFLLGEQYFVLEALYRFVFKGGERAHISMLAVGGLCCVAVGAINQIPRFYKLHVRVQALIGTIITLIIELIAGLILNVWLGFAIWDYTDLWGNIYGQVSIAFALIWFFLMPFAIWLEDKIVFLYSLYLKHKGKSIDDMVIYDYTVLDIYKEFFSFDFFRFNWRRWFYGRL